MFHQVSLKVLGGYYLKAAYGALFWKTTTKSHVGMSVWVRPLSDPVLAPPGLLCTERGQLMRLAFQVPGFADGVWPAETGV